MHQQQNSHDERDGADHPAKYGSILRANALLALGLLTLSGCTDRSEESTPENEPTPIVAPFNPESESIPASEANIVNEVQINPDEWRPELSEEVTTEVYQRSIDHALHHFRGEEKMQRVFEAAVVMKDFSDHFSYGHGTTWSKPEDQSQEDYDANLRQYFNNLVQQDIEIELQAEELLKEAHVNLIDALETRVGFEGWSYQYALINPEFRRSFAEAALKHDLNPDAVLSEASKIRRLLQEAGVPVDESVTDENSQEVRQKIERYAERRPSSISVLGWDLLGNPHNDAKEAVQNEKVVNFLATDAPGLFGDIRKSAQSYWMAAIYSRMNARCEVDSAFASAIDGQSMAGIYDRQQKLQAIAGIASIKLIHRVGLANLCGDGVSYGVSLNQTKEHLEKASYSEKEREKFADDIHQLQEACGISEEQIASVFRLSDRFVSDAFEGHDFFQRALTYYARASSEMADLRGSMAYIESRAIELGATTADDIAADKNTLREEHDKVLTRAKSAKKLGQLVFREIYEVPRTLEYHKEVLSRKIGAGDETVRSLERQQASVKYEATVQLHQLGFNSELARELPQRLRNYLAEAKTESTKTEIESFATSIERLFEPLYHPYTAPSRVESEPNQEQTSLFDQAKSAALDLGLAPDEIETALDEGRDLARALTVQSIGRYHPLDFRASGGSGVLFQP